MSEVHFGGPDRPPRLLRDLLEARVAAVPPGGAIDWATYYFRDRALALSLIAASDRGVGVTLHVEGDPRRADANDNVLAMLSQHGLGGGLHIHARPSWLAPRHHPYLHAKLYCFSHPEPSALVGSFNPSGDEPEDPVVIADIGDQDRGHNLLVEYREPALVDPLRRHVRGLGRLGQRLRFGRTIASGATTIFLYPRLRTNLIDKQIAGLGTGARIRGAISHMKTDRLAAALGEAALRGAEVRLIVHDTERRVRSETIRALTDQGVAISRYQRADPLPLHVKFLLTEQGSESCAWFGSFNYNARSRRRNHEILVRSREPALFAALDARFEEIARG